MELRNQLLIFLGLVLSGALDAAPIKQWPLDDRAAYPIRLGVDAPTTIHFPAALTALDGANVSSRSEDSPAVLLSYQPGASFFSVRALKPDAAAALNVVFHEKVFALTFTTGGEPDRVVEFHENPTVPSCASTANSPERWLALLDRAKHFAALAAQYPALVSDVERTTPKTSTDCGGYSATIEEAFRYNVEDVVIFRLRFANPSRERVRYDTRHLAIRVGPLTLPASLAEASGSVPAQQAVIAWVVIVGQPGEPSSGLSLKNNFAVVAPRAP